MTTDSRPNTFAPYDETSRRALICDADPAMQKNLAATLAPLRLRMEAVGSIDQLMESVKYNQYDFVIVNEQFGLNPRGENEAIGFFEEMPMSARRLMLIVLLSQTLPTLDNLTAYANNVNVVINMRDAAQIASILTKSAAENERFFRAMRETLSHRGRS